MGNDFEIDDSSPEYHNSQKRFSLPKQVKLDLVEKIEVLKTNPESVIRKLKGKYEGVYAIYIGKEWRSHRLQCKINWNKRKITLLNIKPRNFAYS
jgi:mRNA-degrading endonuclease RelE of RelBE toxin-antitoxin system